MFQIAAYRLNMTADDYVSTVTLFQRLQCTSLTFKPRTIQQSHDITVVFCGFCHFSLIFSLIFS